MQWAVLFVDDSPWTYSSFGVIRRTPGHRELIYSDQSSCPKLYWNYDEGTKVEEKDSNSKPSNNSSNHSFNKSMDTMSGDPNDCLLRLLVL